MRDQRLAKLRGVYVIADDAPHWPHSMERVVDAAVRVGAATRSYASRPVQRTVTNSPDCAAQRCT